MEYNAEHIDLGLIRRAQAGEKEAQTLLLKCIEPRVRTYIFRMTMDEHVRDDLSQETLLELVKSLSGLTFQHTNLFWAWLYRTALNKIRRHYRVQGEKRLNIKYLGDKMQMLGHAENNQSGVEHLLHYELCQAIVRAVSNLQLRYRSILILRCFDELSYPEVASVMGISEARARLYFFRAKQLLKRHLNSSGFKKNYLLSALGAFACLTASESHKATAATAISAGAVKSTWTTVMLGILTSKTVLSVLGLLLAAGLLVGHVAKGPSTAETTIPTSDSLEISPTLDNNLMRIYDDIAYNTPRREYDLLMQVRGTNHPANEDWKHFVFWPQLTSARMLKSPIDNTIASLFVLGKDRWIEYELPRKIRDREGPEVALSTFSWGPLPRVYVTDGGQKKHQIFTTSWSEIYNPGKYVVLGFDLSPLDIPFEIRGIRIEGTNDDGPYGGCGIDDPAIFLKPRYPMYRDNDFLDPVRLKN